MNFNRTKELLAKLITEDLFNHNKGSLKDQQDLRISKFQTNQFKICQRFLLLLILKKLDNLNRNWETQGTPRAEKMMM